MSHRKPSIRRLHKFIAAALIVGFPAVAAFAEATARFDIPVQSLSSALRALAGQTGIQVVFAPETVGSAKSAALKGEMSVEAALKQLLAGSGLEFRRESERNYVVVRAVREEGSLSEMVVTATRTERRVDEVPAAVSVITDKTLATKNPQNVYEALRDVESLDFPATPGVAHQNIPTIRGVGATTAGSTTQMLVDGLATDSVVSAVLGRGGLNFMPLQDVERVEVVRGPASALYGPSAVGGVINVIPKRWVGAPGVEINASYGTHDTQTYGVAAGLANERFDMRVSGYDARSGGFKSQPVQAPGSTSGFDLAGRDWKDHKIGMMAGFRPADDQEITFGLRQYATRSAGDFGGRPNDRQDFDGQTTTLSYRYFISADTNVRLDYRANRLTQRYTFDKWDISGIANNLTLASFGGRNSNSTAFQAILDTRPTNENQLIVGYGTDRGNFTQFSTSVGRATTTFDSTSKVDALFVEDEQRFGALALTAGVRHDRINLSPYVKEGTPSSGKGSLANVVNPRLGARYRLNSSTSFYAVAGEAYVPALNSLKFPIAPPNRADNPNLKPESSKSQEIGMNNRWPFGTLRTSLYHTDYKDKITLGVDPATGKGQWQNVAVVKVDGLEIAFQGDLGHGWLPYANYAVTKARNFATAGAPGTQSLRVAPHKFNAGLTYAPGDVWSATLNVRWVSGQYFNSITQAQWADAYTQADMKISARLPNQGQKWEAFLAVNNLSDKQYEPFNKGEWSDGRTVTVGLSGKF